MSVSSHSEKSEYDEDLSSAVTPKLEDQSPVPSGLDHGFIRSSKSLRYKEHSSGADMTPSKMMFPQMHQFEIEPNSNASSIKHVKESDRDIARDMFQEMKIENYGKIYDTRKKLKR